MTKAFADLPGWSFEIMQPSPGTYRIAATAGGQQFEMTGADCDSLLIDCREEAVALTEQAQFERPSD